MGQLAKREVLFASFLYHQQCLFSLGPVLSFGCWAVGRPGKGKMPGRRGLAATQGAPERGRLLPGQEGD